MSPYHLRGGANDYGDLRQRRTHGKGSSNNTRGMVGGGSNNIDYIRKKLILLP